jgi:hypothetical protein
MKKKVLLMVLTIVMGGALNAQEDNLEKYVTGSVERLISTIEESLINANSIIEGVELTSAKVSLKVVSAKKKGGGLKLFVKAKYDWEKSLASTMTFNFENIGKKTIPKNKENEILEAPLTNLIVTAYDEYKKVKDKFNNVSKTGFETTLAFTVKKEGGVGLEIPILGIGADFGTNRENELVHTITLTFEKK